MSKALLKPPNKIFFIISSLFILIGCYFQFNGLKHRLDSFENFVYIFDKFSHSIYSVAITLFTFYFLNKLKKN